MLVLVFSINVLPSTDLTFCVLGVILSIQESDKSFTYEPDSPLKKGV